MAAVAAVTFSGKLACDFSLEFKRECYTNKFAVHSRTCTECTPTILVHTRLRHFRDKSHAKSAAVACHKTNDLSRTATLPRVQQATLDVPEAPAEPSVTLGHLSLPYDPLGAAPGPP